MGQRLKGKVALITGAARGQGEAEARLFVAEGARVLLGDVRDDRDSGAAPSRRGIDRERRLGGGPLRHPGPRRLLRLPNNNEHVSFGLSAHFCLGSHLARLEARIAAAALLERLPNLRLDPAEACSIRGFAFRSPDRLPVLFR